LTERKLVLALAVTAAFLSAVLFFLDRRDAVRVAIVPPPVTSAP
jgi:hypothetical protein